MPDSAELITVYRQIGGMMEAGVDILRITRVLRAQTENTRLLRTYDEIDRRLTMGQSLVEAMEASPEVFSPFVISLVQQGELRNDIGSAFLKAADYLQQEGATHTAPLPSASVEMPLAAPETATVSTQNPSSPLAVIALDGLIDRLLTLGLRALTLGSGLLLALALVWWSFESGLIERRWLQVTLYSVAALFIGVSGVWLQRRIKAERRRAARCSFCGRSEENERLQRAPRFPDAAICTRCASLIAAREHEPVVSPSVEAAPSSEKEAASKSAYAPRAASNDDAPAAEEDYE